MESYNITMSFDSNGHYEFRNVDDILTYYNDTRSYEANFNFGSRQALLEWAANAIPRLKNNLVPLSIDCYIYDFDSLMDAIKEDKNLFDVQGIDDWNLASYRVVFRKTNGKIPLDRIVSAELYQKVCNSGLSDEDFAEMLEKALDSRTAE